MTDINFNNFDPEIKNVLISTFLTAIEMYEKGRTQEDFMTMCMEVWEFLRKNDLEIIKDILMKEKLKKNVK